MKSLSEINGFEYIINTEGFEQNSISQNVDFHNNQFEKIADVNVLTSIF